MNEKLAREIQRFPWGTIVNLHKVGDYTIIEYIEKRHSTAPEDWMPKTLFHPFVRDEDTNTSVHSLDTALVFAIAFKAENGNRNSQAAHYFAKMIDLK